MEECCKENVFHYTYCPQYQETPNSYFRPFFHTRGSHFAKLWADYEQIVSPCGAVME